MLEHTEWIVVGFEIVQSHFAGPRFAAADCTATYWAARRGILSYARRRVVVQIG